MKEICICQCGVVAENWSTDFIYTLSPSRQKQMLKPWLLDVKLSFWTWSYQNSGYAIIIINCVIFSESTFLKQFVVFIISLKLLKNLGCQGLHIHTYMPMDAPPCLHSCHCWRGMAASPLSCCHQQSTVPACGVTSHPLWVSHTVSASWKMRNQTILGHMLIF